VANLDAASRPPPLPLGRWADRSTVKHALQNTQNDCHQWLSRSFRVHRIRSRPGQSPGPCWESLQRSPQPIAGLRGTLLLRGRGGEGTQEGTGEERRKGEERGKGKPP